MGPYIHCCGPSKYNQQQSLNRDSEDLRVSLWILNMLQNEREIENEAWLGTDQKTQDLLCIHGSYR